MIERTAKKYWKIYTWPWWQERNFYFNTKSKSSSKFNATGNE